MVLLYTSADVVKFASFFLTARFAFGVIINILL